MKLAKLKPPRPKPHKYPRGYPGDAQATFPLAERCFRPIRMRFRYHCHACSTVFQRRENICGACGHERCPLCLRHPPKRIKTEPVEALMDRVSQKLAGVDIASPAAAV